jgi:hypothetical protein
VADLTGNGIPDIATANYYDNTVSVLLGNGDGTFQPAATYAVGAGPVTIAAGYFGTDADVPDLAVVNNTSGTLSVLVNHGDGTFERHVDYPVGADPLGIAVGDFANTGTQDIAVANFQSNTVSLLPGNGDHTFQRAASIAVPGGPDRLVAGDFNNDGNLDLAVTVTSGNNNAFRILLGDGTGHFAPSLNFPTGGDPGDIVAADLTNDGYTDLVTANITGRSYTVLLNDGVWDTKALGPRILGTTGAGVAPEQSFNSPPALSGSLARSPTGARDPGSQDRSVDRWDDTASTDHDFLSFGRTDLAADHAFEPANDAGALGTPRLQAIALQDADNVALCLDWSGFVDGLLERAGPGQFAQSILRN